jgi:type I restriction enzyme S subunit
MDEWERLSLKKAGIALIDCVHATPNSVASGYPYIAIPQMKDGRIDFASSRQINSQDFADWTKKARPRKHDVVLSRRTNPGVTAPVQERTDFALGQNLVLLRSDGTRVIPGLLRWLVSSPEWWAQIEKFLNVGAIFNSLRCADVPNFELLIPPLSDQEGIAAVLSALDDKIELNRRMNETLEAVARALFRDWFVDFGPTRAKTEGRPPYLTADIWSLFPNRLDNEGKPEGWTWSTIGAEVDAAGGSTPSTSIADYWGGDIRWTTPKDLSGLNSPILLSTARTISKTGLSTISSGLLPVGTVLMSSRAPVGYLAIAQIPLAINQGYIAMRCSKRISNWAAYLWAKENMDAIVQNANGSTFQEISKANFRPLPILVASADIRSRFDGVVAPMFRRIIANEMESRTLAETRDLLLPKLMSGEIRVRAVEKLVGNQP